MPRGTRGWRSRRSRPDSEGSPWLSVVQHAGHWSVPKHGLHRRPMLRLRPQRRQEADMSLMDKVRAQATQIAQKTQETARDSKVKFDQAQAKRRADAMLRNLGAVVYADRTGRGTGDSAAEIDRLVTEVSSHEAEHEISLARVATDQAGPAPESPAAPGTAAEG